MRSALLLLYLVAASITAAQPIADNKDSLSRKKGVPVLSRATKAKINYACLRFDEQGRACWMGTPSLIRFSGCVFAEGDNWRAEWTYKEGVLDGPVQVTVDEKLLYRFYYEQGQKAYYPGEYFGTGYPLVGSPEWYRIKEADTKLNDEKSQK